MHQTCTACSNLPVCRCPLSTSLGVLPKFCLRSVAMSSGSDTDSSSGPEEAVKLLKALCRAAKKSKKKKGKKRQCPESVQQSADDEAPGRREGKHPAKFEGAKSKACTTGQVLLREAPAAAASGPVTGKQPETHEVVAHPIGSPPRSARQPADAAQSSLHQSDASSARPPPLAGSPARPPSLAGSPARPLQSDVVSVTPSAAERDSERHVPSVRSQVDEEDPEAAGNQVLDLTRRVLCGLGFAWRRKVWECMHAEQLTGKVVDPQRFVSNVRSTVVCHCDQIPMWLRIGASKMCVLEEEVSKTNKRPGREQAMKDCTQLRQNAASEADRFRNGPNLCPVTGKCVLGRA